MTAIAWLGAICAAAYLLKLAYEVWVTVDAILRWEDEKREATE